MDLSPSGLEQCLAHSKCSVNICEREVLATRGGVLATGVGSPKQCSPDSQTLCPQCSVIPDPVSPSCRLLGCLDPSFLDSRLLCCHCPLFLRASVAQMGHAVSCSWDLRMWLGSCVSETTRAKRQKQVLLLMLTESKSPGVGAGERKGRKRRRGGGEGKRGEAGVEGHEQRSRGDRGPTSTHSLAPRESPSPWSLARARG